MTRRLIYVASFCTLIYLIDFHIPKALPSAGDKVTEQIGTILITGANSGVGYETARALAVTYGKDVMLGCRSATKCSAAAKTINDEVAGVGSSGKAIPMHIDLSDFESVSAFVLQLEGKCSAAAKTINDEVAGVGSSGKAIPMHIDLSDFESVFSLVQQLEGAGQKGKIDVLFNNAGYGPRNNIPVDSYGLNPAFTSMHLSHHLLTELLLKTNNPELRVINTSSFSHHLCAIPFAYLPSFLLEWLNLSLDAGCLDEQYFREDLYSKTKRYVTYFEAKVANVMHAVELPRRHHQSVAVAVDLGWVRTEMQPWMIFPLLGWMRNARIGLRVINTSSFSHHLCAIPFAYLPSFLLEWLNLSQNAGCLDEQYFKEDLYSKTKTSTYFEAKIANMMHTVELPRRHGSVAVAVDLGWVGTAIQPWMRVSLSPTSLGWMRNARIGILPVLHAIFTPGTELLQGLRGEEGTWADGGVVMNSFGHSMEAFSTYHWWRDAAGLGRNRMLGLSELLWDTSSSVLRKNGY
eukprot:CAMPEP_0194227460 /NCGR_PEP_ID=MMETSP0156-20130528/42864_1 /TAXON_ID=33649 /ORGANISM="Thalassionema nitzschioides, Strain L26-B" /LENGTH=517 /DNA_ID=CAMNT_0038959941 /DNA_START=261 /DNA_END=1814 /DNA_ORIENTATION=-